MDANKLKVLQDLPYEVRRSCGLCKHGWFPNNDWGTCKIISYAHEKHVGDARQLSVHKYGNCPKFIRRDDLFVVLGSFLEFIK